MSENLKNKTITNLFWRFAERCGAQLVGFVVSIILARLLTPNDYGLIALITIFTKILEVFVDSGFGNALIQKKDADDLDFSTVFYTNIVFCLFLYGLIYFSSPLLGKFFNNTSLVSVMRVLSLTIVISGLKNVQQAYVSKKLIFKKFFLATLAGTVIAAVIGIYMAYKGFGVWALVAQQLINTTIDTCVLWVIVKWRPKLMFSFNRLKALFSYGWKMLVSSLIDTIYRDIRQLVIGKAYSPEDLAFYNKGGQFPSFVSGNINTSIDSVLLPVLSEVQDDRDRVKQLTRRSIMVSSYIMWPLLIGLAATSNTIVSLLLTDKWLPCVPFLCIACLDNGLRPLQTANLNAIKAIGRSDLILKLEIIKKTISTIIVFATMPFGVMAIALGGAVYTIIASIINSFPNKKLLGYSYLEQLCDIIPAFLLAVVMGLAVYFIPLGNINLIVKLIIQVSIGILVYLLGSIVLKLESYSFFKKTLFGFLKKRRQGFAFMGIKKLLYILLSYLPLRKIILFESNPDFSDNSYDVYLYLREKNFDQKYKFVWAVTSPSSLKRKDIKTVKYRSLICYYYSFVSAVTVYSHRFLGNPKNKKQKRLFLVHGFSLKKSKGFFWNEQYNTNIICLSDFHLKMRKLTMPNAGNRSIITGFPRNDRLFIKNKEGLSKFGIDNDEKLIVWLPTFRHMDKSVAARCDITDDAKEFELLNEKTLDEIDEFLVGKKIKLIVKYHPSQDPSLVTVSNKYNNIITLLSVDYLKYNINLYDLLAVSDALISDFSSVYIDYLLLNKPIAFDVSDIKSYSKGLGFLVDNPLDYMPGHLVTRKEDLQAFISDLSNGTDPFKNKREEIANIMHKNRDGNSTERVVDYLIK